MAVMPHKAHGRTVMDIELICKTKKMINNRIIYNRDLFQKT